MKVQEILENVAMGAVSGGAIAGNRGLLFSGGPIKREHLNKQPKKVPKIKYSNRNNWNVGK